jgi:hypothetical protein
MSTTTIYVRDIATRVVVVFVIVTFLIGIIHDASLSNDEHGTKYDDDGVLHRRRRRTRTVTVDGFFLAPITSIRRSATSLSLRSNTMHHKNILKRQRYRTTNDGMNKRSSTDPSNGWNRNWPIASFLSVCQDERRTETIKSTIRIDAIRRIDTIFTPTAFMRNSRQQHGPLLSHTLSSSSENDVDGRDADFYEEDRKSMGRKDGIFVDDDNDENDHLGEDVDNIATVGVDNRNIAAPAACVDDDDDDDDYFPTESSVASIRAVKFCNIPKEVGTL